LRKKAAVRNFLLLLLMIILSSTAFAQHTVKMRNLWARPQVHVMFGTYTVSFTIKDINRALSLLAEAGDSTYGMSCGLDTGKNYFIELFPGIHNEYRNSLQRLLQNGIGAFLITAGRAQIINEKHKKILAVISDVQPVVDGLKNTYVTFYDPNTDKMVFSGRMIALMYHKDVGID
jgi:hypothetical protein